MTFEAQPEYIVSFRGKSGAIEEVRTDDVEATKKQGAIRGLKVASIQLSKRHSAPNADLTKALITKSINRLIGKAATGDLNAQEDLRKLFDHVPGVDYATIGSNPDALDRVAVAVYETSRGSDSWVPAEWTGPTLQDFEANRRGGKS